MFSDMVAELTRGTLPEPDSLRRRLDIALTKKLGVVRLPPAFWMQDPKINPRSDHLLWAALLLMDRERIDLALTIIAAEVAEEINPASITRQLQMEIKVHALIDTFFEQIPEPVMRQKMRQNLHQIIPEWIDDNGKNLV